MFAPSLRWVGAWVLGLSCACLPCTPSIADDKPATTEAESASNALSFDTVWGGARNGPPARIGARVAIVCEDLRNGGVLGVTRGIREAAGEIGWQTKIFDAGGNPAGRDRALTAANAQQPDGVIVVGTDARAIGAGLAPFAERGIPVVGWHVDLKAGALDKGPIAINVSSDPLEVARVTAAAAVSDARGAGVVIVTDSNFDIALAKAEAMAIVVRRCAECKLLEIRDIAISTAAETMPKITREWLARHGIGLTHLLAINDIYFDYAVPELTQSGRSSASIALLSAGDGSPAAFLRIRAGAFQTATAAEPLNLQGWQLIDELNRLLSGQAVTGYVVPVHLVTAANIASEGAPDLLYDPNNGYREIFRHIWKP
ncbi:substrate-binding domain-containing protein [Methylomonas sp. UP202]|uniref:substrate-binding domain-containing protein n=1 Tax=Methylomonas sp. UP202 TaxID=3040943 RepID=UPI00247ADAED|nr:substrate-binding domain-containing protein [Methylomonas sp. UP202]WGS88381.1 substrate-binding domain-containing protein [Methylomonas sp. UP202]